MSRHIEFDEKFKAQIPIFLEFENHMHERKIFIGQSLKLR